MVHIIFAQTRDQVHEPLVYEEDHLDAAKKSFKSLQEIAAYDKTIKVELFTNLRPY